MLKRALEGVGVARRNQGWRSWRARSLGTEVPKERVECVVIGAGVVGTAVARELALRGREVLVLDSAPTFGTGNTSRNSEVIHAGIYYPPDSLKIDLRSYQKPGHTRDTCRKIHGKPADWKPSRPASDRESRGNHAAAEEGTSSIESSPFNKEQLETLQKMFSQQDTSHNIIGTGLVAQKGFDFGEDDWQC